MAHSRPARPRRLPRRGLTGGQLLAVIGGGVVVLAIGFALGRSAGDRPSAEGETAPAAVTTAVDPTERPASTPAAGSDPAPAPAPVPALAGSARVVGAAPVANAGPATPATPAGPPPFEFDPPSVDFGLVPPDTEMRETILVRNVSDRPLRILAMKSDCKCTTTEDLTGTVIPPGGHVPVNAVMEGRPSPGSKNSEIRFVFEGWGKAAIEIRSNVSRAVRVQPAAMTATETFAGEIEVTSLDGKPFRILAVNGQPPVFADGFVPTPDTPVNAYRLPWDLSGFDKTTCLDADGARLPGWWVIETDHPHAPIVDVPVRHLPCTLPEKPVNRSWALSQRRAVVGVLAPGESTEIEVYLKWYRIESPNDTIREVRSESDQFDATLESVDRVDDRITCRVKVTPRPGFEGRLYGPMRFYGYRPEASAPLVVIGRVTDVGDQQAAR